MPSLRNSAIQFLARSGAISGALLFKNSNPVIIMYHGVTDCKNDPSSLHNANENHISREVFRHHLEVIRRRRRTILIDEMVKGLIEGDDLRNTVAITFDDGYENNFLVAAPLLTEYQIPATFYLATGFIGADQYIWTDRVEMLFECTLVREVRSTFMDEVLPLDSLNAKHVALRKAKAAFKELTAAERQTAIDELGDLLQVKLGRPELPDCKFMSWDQARELSKSGFDIGAHSVSHPILSRESLDVARKEILESRDRIVREIGRCSAVFCYPNGKPNDYSPGIIDICQQHFIGALSTSRGFARVDQAFQLRRIGAYSGAMSHFIEWTLLLER